MINTLLSPVRTVLKAGVSLFGTVYLIWLVGITVTILFFSMVNSLVLGM